MQYERYLIHTAGSAGQGMVNLAGRSQNVSSLRTLWGGNPVAGEGGGNGGVFERKKQPTFNALERNALGEAELNRTRLDPISSTLKRIMGR